MKCPKCNSEKITIVNNSYPPSYECLECGFTFIRMENPLIEG